MSQSEYTITIGPGGSVEVNLVTEGINQAQVCQTIQNFTNSLGRVTEHEDRGCDPQPVNLNLNIPNS